MADRSNYADKPITEDKVGSLTEHRLNLGNDSRGFTPTSGETDGEGRHGNLSVSSQGDPYWKPQRYKADPGITLPYDYDLRLAALERQMPTFRGVPKGAAEMFRGETFLHA